MTIERCRDRAEGADRGRWQALWAEFEMAQRAGRLSEAATLCQRIAEAEPPDGRLLHDAGAFILALNRNLAGLAALNEGHCHRFALTAEQFRAPVPSGPIGRQGWALAQRCLLAASLREPDRVDWQLSLAEVLERSGHPAQALHWRRNVARLQPGRHDNVLALGRLRDALAPATTASTKRSLSVPTDDAPLPASRADLARVRARHAWTRGERIAGLRSYLAAVAPFLVAELPLEYEIRSGYKVLFDAPAGRFLAVPRHVAEFTIIDGAVYVVTGAARLSHRKLPPWMIASALRLVACARLLAQRLPFGERALRVFKRAALVLWRQAVVRRTVRALAAFGWRRYLVRGVLVADRLETLLDLIEHRPPPQGARTQPVPRLHSATWPLSSEACDHESR